MSCVNVIVSGLPGTSGVLCLRMGDVLTGIRAYEVEEAISATTGIPSQTLLLRVGCTVLRGASSGAGQLVSAIGDHTAFVRASLRKALPGGKGGFGSQLKSGAKTATAARNVDACRDLRGRRIGAVRRDNAQQARKRARTPSAREDGEDHDGEQDDEREQTEQQDRMQEEMAVTKAESVQTQLIAQSRALDGEIEAAFRDARLGNGVASSALKKRKTQPSPSPSCAPALDLLGGYSSSSSRSSDAEEDLTMEEAEGSRH